MKIRDQLMAVGLWVAIALFGTDVLAESPFKPPPMPSRQVDELLGPKALTQPAKGSLIARGRSVAFRSGVCRLILTDDGTPRAVAINQQEFDLGVDADGGLMLKPVTDQPPPLLPARDVIPDARAGKGRREIREAWLIQPTTRYVNGVLGDTVEASALRVTLANGTMIVERAPGGSVFEDLEPRIADIDGDGREDVLVIRSTANEGASVVAYGLAVNAQGRTILRELAATNPLGKPKVWLNPIGVADFDGDGRPELAVVEYPYTDGVLSFWRLQNGQFINAGRQNGFSNHKMGSTQMGMAVMRDLDGDGIQDLIVPSLDRKTLRLITFKEGRVREMAQLPLKAAVKTDILWFNNGILMGLEDNSFIHMTLLYR